MMPSFTDLIFKLLILMLYMSYELAEGAVVWFVLLYLLKQSFADVYLNSCS